ncbi:MAG: hypothetical protein IH936_02870 [Acidobacteria bacterium]|nr:hypothetical protein [Acidobacteriota bacterium]
MEEAVARFTTKIGQPLVVVEESRRSIRYPNQSPEVVRVLKAVRVVSGLNACAVLLSQGLVVEVEVLLRTVDEFLTDIIFLRREDDGRVGDRQWDFIEDFFTELPTKEEMWQSRKQPGRVSRAKVLAGESRYLAEVTGDPHTITSVSKNLAELAGRYVHGAFAGIMELYRDDGYCLSGVNETAQITPHGGNLTSFIHRSLNVFAALAHDLGLLDLMNDLVASRRAFEKSGAHPSTSGWQR